MTMDKLREFRTIYLRAIAEAWTHEAFRENLVARGGSIRALEDRFEWHWPWPNVCDLQVADSTIRLHPEDPNDPEVGLEWIGDEWVWPLRLMEDMAMYLPLSPKDVNDVPIAPAHRAAALADYHRQRSALFSDDWGKEDDSPPVPWPSSGLGGGVADFVPHDREFAEFKLVLIAALAKAWNDEDFKRKLMIDAAMALQTIRGYQLPWKLNLILRDHPKARWHPADPESSPKVSHWTFTDSSGLVTHKHKLILGLPKVPDDVDCHPVALAAYNATGAEYPFSCTC